MEEGVRGSLRDDGCFSGFASKSIGNLAENNSDQISSLSIFAGLCGVADWQVGVRRNLLGVTCSPAGNDWSEDRSSSGHAAFEHSHSEIVLSGVGVDPVNHFVIRISIIRTPSQVYISLSSSVAQSHMSRIINITSIGLYHETICYSHEMSGFKSKIVEYDIVGKHSSPELHPSHKSIGLRHQSHRYHMFFLISRFSCHQI